MKKAELTEQRKRIERAYQRAMNIRDSVQSDMTEAEESAYGRAYRKAYRSGDSRGFRATTRNYLRNLRSLSKAYQSLDRLLTPPVCLGCGHVYCICNRLEDETYCI